MKPKGIENGEAIHKRTYKVQTLWNGSTVAPSTYLLTAINGDNYNLSSMVENSSGGSRNRYILSRLVLSWHTTTEESYHAIQVGEHLHQVQMDPVEIQGQPKHLLKEKILDGSVDGSDSGSGSGFFRGRCLKNAFTAPSTPSSFSMSLASSTARSFTWHVKFIG